MNDLEENSQSSLIANLIC